MIINLSKHNVRKIVIRNKSFHVLFAKSQRSTRIWGGGGGIGEGEMADGNCDQKCRFLAY